MIRRWISRIRRGIDWRREHRENRKTFPDLFLWDLYITNSDYRDSHYWEINRGNG
jgi:hypothetical protein